MADTKITALTALTAADPSTDVLPIVDTSDTTMAASGTTKKISINNILGASGTATLASATITGDLTVATSVLKVDTANTRVGINTTSINGGPFNVKISPTIDAKFVVQDGFTTGNVRLAAVDNAYSTYKMMDFSALSYAWYNSGSTAMTLNSTGLGVGVSPAVKLDIGGAATQQFRIQMSGQADTRVISDTGAGIVGTYSNHKLIIRTNSTDAVTVDASQNVGIGVTPTNKFQVRTTSDGVCQFIGRGGGTNNPNFQVSFADATTTTTINAGSGAGNPILTLATAGSDRLIIDASGNVIVNSAAIATTATDGFLYIPGCAGTPTGTPTAKTGRVPLVVDTTNNKLYFYSGGAWVAAN